MVMEEEEAAAVLPWGDFELLRRLCLAASLPANREGTLVGTPLRMASPTILDHPV